MLNKIRKAIYEAEERAAVESQGITFPIGEVIVRSYDETVGYAGRARKPMIDWVTEYNYVSKENLTPEQFDKVLEENGHHPTGQIEYYKRRLTYRDEVYYRHICKAIMY